MSGLGSTRRHAGRAQALVCVGVILSACHGLPRTHGPRRALAELDDRPHNVVFDLSVPIPENTNAGGLLPLPPERTFAGLIGALERAKAAPAPGYFVRLGENTFDWAKTQELGQALGALRGPDHPVICHGNAFSNASMWLALAGCDQIWLSPAGTVDTVGIAAESVYLKRLLERFKVHADFLHVGRYKSAAETLTRDGPSDDAKESLESVLASIRQTWLEGVGKLNRDPAIVGALEAGPWVPKAALAAGMITHIGYESEARSALAVTTHVEQFESSFGPGQEQHAAAEAAELLHALGGVSDSVGSPHVAILPASGGINMGGGEGMQEGITSEGLARQIRALKRDNSVKAVVLRIDSPGGSALASDLLWHELMELRSEKPLIASVGSMAASGGYYLASAADVLIAEETSIVGSIGVVGGKIVLNEALDEFGVSTQVFSAKPGDFARQRAAYLSSISGWDDATRERVQEQMQAVYDLFIERVAEGRHLDPNRVREVAEGRIWSGAQGRERGLVDEFGGLSEATKRAKERAGLAPDAPVTVEGPSGGLLEMLGLGSDSDDADTRAALLRAQAKEPEWWSVVTPGLRSQFEGLLPLLGGERVLAVAPFAFELH